MPRRGENIRKRKDGRWEGRYSVFEPQAGKKVIHSVYAKTYSEVKEKLSAAKVTANSQGKISDAEVSFRLAAKEWLTTVESSRKHATYVKYRSVYERHIQEKLDGYMLPNPDEDIFIKVFQNKMEEPMSDSLQKSVSCVLNQILSYAAMNYHIRPCSCTFQKKTVAKKPVEVLSKTEQTKLLKYLYEEMDIYKLGIVLCISTGLRLGEICSLKWEDIDFNGKVLYVNTTVQRIAVKGQNSRTMLLEGEPKSIFSRRGIPLSDEIIKLLSPYHNDSGTYVIKNDKPMEPRTYQNKFHKYLECAGVENKNFHILRHTFATNCINSGTDIKSLSEILGHSDVKITLNRYVHPTMETKREHMNSLSFIYGQYLGQ